MVGGVCTLQFWTSGFWLIKRLSSRFWGVFGANLSLRVTGQGPGGRDFLGKFKNKLPDMAILGLDILGEVPKAAICRGFLPDIAWAFSPKTRFFDGV